MSTIDVRDEASEEGSFYAYFGPEYRGRLLFFRVPVIEEPGRVDTVVSELYRLNEEPSAKPGETTRTAFLHPVPEPEGIVPQSTPQVMELFFQFFVDSLEHRGHFSRMSERLSSTFTFAPAAQFLHVQTLNELKNILTRLPIIPQGTVEAIVTDYPFVFANPTWKDDPDLVNKVTVPDEYLNRFLVSDEPLDRIPPGNKDYPYNILDSQVYRIQLWKNLKVNRLFDSTTLRIIQSIASMQTLGTYSLEFARELKRYVEFLSSLNSIAVTLHDSAFSIVDAAKQINRPAYLNSCDFVSDAVLQSGPYSKEYHAARIVSQSFLWTAWQRATMLLFYLALVAILNGEKPDQWLDLLSVAGFDLMENIVTEIEDAVADTTELGYLCNWTFELLRTNRASLTLDFRTLFHRLIAKFGT
ncbi:hypothetical protein DIS24_g7113 [Lasiodiplodia hormozganensis]|uniref:Uncharacterized protein n=1 Tax=Lasiodiplodia hormozganensis TaxID=869390 RepID=A0AA39YCJ8_9PEZI|nr:hypothetical protein DIS24_g7113 [Lasiodiplodia hormozganensis]